MPYRFVKEKDVLGAGTLLKQQGVPSDQWDAALPKMLGALEESRFQEQPPVYKKIYTAATKADPFTRTMMGTYKSLIGKTSGALLKSAGEEGGGATGFFSNINLVHKAIDDALASGEAEPETWGGRLLQDTLPSLVPDLPLFALAGRAGVHPSIMLGTYDATRQGLDINMGKQEKFDLKSLAKSMILGKVLKNIPLPKQLKGVAGGAVSRVGKRLAGAGVKALPASFVSPAVELLDPTTNEKWEPEDFAHTWALFASLDAWGLIKAGQFGALETQLKSQGLNSKQATELSNLASTDPRASVHKMFSVLMKNKVGIKDAANAWKAWQTENWDAGRGGPSAEPPMKTAAMEKAGLAKYGEPAKPVKPPIEMTAVPVKGGITFQPDISIKGQLVSALEAKATQRAITPHRAKWYTKAAAKINSYEGDIAGLDREGVRNLLGMKGKKSKVVDTVVDVIKSLSEMEKETATRIPEVPVEPIESTEIATLPEPEPQFGEPTLAQYVTPQDRYIYTLGLQDVLMPQIKAKTALLLERQKLEGWVDQMEQDYLTKAGTTTKAKFTSWVKNTPTKDHTKFWSWLNTPKMKLKDVPLDHREMYKNSRKLSDDIIDRVNVIREHVGLEPIKYLAGYVRYIYDLSTQKSIKENHPLPPDVEYWTKKSTSKHVFNPTALKRKGKTEGLVKDPFKALKAMIAVDLKQIYLERPNLLFKEQMKELTKSGKLPVSTRIWAEGFMNVVINGFPSDLDKQTDRSLEKMKIPQVMDAVLKPVNRTWGPSSIRNISDGIGRLVHNAVIWGRMKLPVRNHTQKFLPLGLYDSKAFLTGIRPAPPECEKMIKESDFFNISRAAYMEAMPAGALNKLEKIGFTPYSHSHMSNVLFTMKVAYHAGMELVNNPKYAELGWTMDDVKAEMDFGANTCQYWYNAMGVPELYRHKTLAPLFKLQSWPMNYAFKYWREMLHRFFTGKTSLGKKIPTKWRLGALRHIMATLLLIHGFKKGLGLNYTQMGLLGVLPAYLSPPGQVVAGLAKLVGADNDREKNEAYRMLKNSWQAFLPGSGVWRDAAKVWSGEEPIEYLFFHTAKD